MPPVLVVVPATALLVPGAAGAAQPLAELRSTLRALLADELAALDRGPVVVLGAGPSARAGRLRPSLAAVGVADARVPALVALGETDVPWDGVAATGPSVALLCLADAGLDLTGRSVDVVEVPGEAATAVAMSAASRVRRAALAVVADQLAPGVDAVLDEVAGAWSWIDEEVVVRLEHEHLPPSYRILVRRPALTS